MDTGGGRAGNREETGSWGITRMRCWLMLCSSRVLIAIQTPLKIFAWNIWVWVWLCEFFLVIRINWAPEAGWPSVMCWWSWLVERCLMGVYNIVRRVQRDFGITPRLSLDRLTMDGPLCECWTTNLGMSTFLFIWMPSFLLCPVKNLSFEKFVWPQSSFILSSKEVHQDTLLCKVWGHHQPDGKG